jgi:DNA invertase Pin-like site-specific DNA recombinase
VCRFRSSYPLGGLAEFERHLIVARTSEGRKHTRAVACCLATGAG